MRGISKPLYPKDKKPDRRPRRKWRVDYGQDSGIASVGYETWSRYYRTALGARVDAWFAEHDLSSLTAVLVNQYKEARFEEEA